MNLDQFLKEWITLFYVYYEVPDPGTFTKWAGYLQGYVAIDNPTHEATADEISGKMTRYAYLRLYGWITNQNPDMYVEDKYPGTRYILTVEVSPLGSGYVVLQPAGGVYREGSIIAMQAFAADGYAFSSWLGPPDEYETLEIAFLTLDRDRTVRAHFAVVDGNGNGNENGEDGNGENGNGNGNGNGGQDLLSQVLPLMIVAMMMNIMTPMMNFGKDV